MGAQRNRKTTIIVPNTMFWVQCENCRGREFAIKGFTQKDGLKISRIVCMTKHCNREYKIDTKGTLGGWITGKQNIVPLKQKQG